jgi:hypothetical protein
VEVDSTKTKDMVIVQNNVCSSISCHAKVVLLLLLL